MSDPAPFVPRPRVARRHAPSFDAENFLRELDVIAHHVRRATTIPVEASSADCPEYDSACTVIVQLAAFLERGEYAPYIGALASSEKRALCTARNIAARSEYQSIDGQLLWTAITRNVPDMIERLRAAAPRG